MWSGGGRGGGKSGIQERRQAESHTNTCGVVTPVFVWRANSANRHCGPNSGDRSPCCAHWLGPVLVRHGIDAGIKAKDSRALNITVIAYLVVVGIAYVIGRMQ